MRSCICYIEDIIYELDKIKWENNGIPPTVISIIPIKLEKMSMQLYKTIEVKIIYRID